jgi:small subunit ribosomal protein S17
MSSVLFASPNAARLGQSVAFRAPARIGTQVCAKRSVEGKVVSAKMDKTATVLVQRYQILDSRYGKRVLRTKKYHMHDEQNECEEGDYIAMKSCPKMSKTKTMKLDRIIRKVVKL